MALEKKLKHLEFIQNTIIRMNSNSFLIKGWCITLVAALFALAAQGSNKDYVIVTYVIIPLFWILDAFYLSIEKQYRALYDTVKDEPLDHIDFRMSVSPYNNGTRTWLSSVFSITLFSFYGISGLTVLLVMFLIDT